MHERFWSIFWEQLNWVSHKEWRNCWENWFFLHFVVKSWLNTGCNKSFCTNRPNNFRDKPLMSHKFPVLRRNRSNYSKGGYLGLSILWEEPPETKDLIKETSFPCTRHLLGREECSLCDLWLWCQDSCIFVMYTFGCIFGCVWNL